jgi:hypothetical protein
LVFWEAAFDSLIKRLLFPSLFHDVCHQPAASAYLRAYILKETSTSLNRFLLISAAVGSNLPGISKYSCRSSHENEPIDGPPWGRFAPFVLFCNSPCFRQRAYIYENGRTCYQTLSEGQCAGVRYSGLLRCSSSLLLTCSQLAGQMGKSFKTLSSIDSLQIDSVLKRILRVKLIHSYELRKDSNFVCQRVFPLNPASITLKPLSLRVAFEVGVTKRPKWCLQWFILASIGIILW